MPINDSLQKKIALIEFKFQLEIEMCGVVLEFGIRFIPFKAFN